MQAFPVGSANMAMGGSGPVNRNLDLTKIHGIRDEGYTDYGSGYTAPRAKVGGSAGAFDTTARVEPVHGEESIGLGTSTFLEGAPASRKAMERRESETEPQLGGPAPIGISRKKSLAQRLRGMSQPRRMYDGPIRSPEPRYLDATSPMSPPQLPRKFPLDDIRQTQSAGGPSRAALPERNPFDNIYDQEYDKKGATIKAAEVDKNGETETTEENGKVDHKAVTGRSRALSSPKPLPLVPDIPGKTSPEPQSKSSAGGFLNRVKSLKGPRRPRRPS